MKILMPILAVLCWALALFQCSVYGSTNTPPTPAEMGLTPPDPLVTGTTPETFIVKWSDGTTTTNQVEDFLESTNVVGICTNKEPTTVTLRATYYDNLNSNIIYQTSFTTQYRKNAFMKTEIIEE